MNCAEKSLKKHYEWKGKIEVVARCPINDHNDLSLAYTPGDAASCLEIEKDIEAAAAAVEANFAGNYPFFVKPASAGSSVCVSKARNNAELQQALVTAVAVCSKVLVEETIVGREVEVAVLGNADAKASVVGEVLSANDFYD